jgi:SAM-dependent methyltransferase
MSDASHSVIDDGPEAFKVPSDYFHGLLHELRTLELERVPKGAQRVLSVGANGRWYFDWFEHSYGPVVRHVGVEAYEPMPGDLPPYVEWIVNTADKMSGVEDSSVDLVFAGQTTEHLWADELAGFLLESHRVLAEGGQLILDSPNRLVTEHLHWSHGGHTVELSAAEITELLTLAGFEVEAVRGLWLCAQDGGVLQLEERLIDAALTTRRIALGADRPDQCFVWWINARRKSVDVDATQLEQRTRQLFAEHWPLRVNRGIMANADDVVLPLPSGSRGVVKTTLPFLMSPGVWTLSATLASGNWSDISGLRFDIVLPGDEVLHHLAMESAAVQGDTLSWSIEQPFVSFALCLRIMLDDVIADAALVLPIELGWSG